MRSGRECTWDRGANPKGGEAMAMAMAMAMADTTQVRIRTARPVHFFSTDEEEERTARAGLQRRGRGLRARR